MCIFSMISALTNEFKNVSLEGDCIFFIVKLKEK